MSAHTSFRLPPYAKSLLIGLCVGVVGGTLLLLIGALLLYKLNLPLGAVTPMALAALGLGGLGGGVAVGLCAKQKGLLLGAVCGTLMYLILLIAGAIRGGDMAPAYAALKWAVVTVCSAVGGVWSVNRRRP